MDKKENTCRITCHWARNAEQKKKKPPVTENLDGFEVGTSDYFSIAVVEGLPEGHCSFTVAAKRAKDGFWTITQFSRHSCSPTQKAKKGARESFFLANALLGTKEELEHDDRKGKHPGQTPSLSETKEFFGKG